MTQPGESDIPAETQRDESDSGGLAYGPTVVMMAMIEHMTPEGAVAAGVDLRKRANRESSSAARQFFIRAADALDEFARRRLAE